LSSFSLTNTLSCYHFHYQCYVLSPLSHSSHARAPLSQPIKIRTLFTSRLSRILRASPPPPFASVSSQLLITFFYFETTLSLSHTHTYLSCSPPPSKIASSSPCRRNPSIFNLSLANLQCWNPRSVEVRILGRCSKFWRFFACLICDFWQDVLAYDWVIDSLSSKFSTYCSLKLIICFCCQIRCLDFANVFDLHKYVLLD
jgi:hypothetical protein